MKPVLLNQIGQSGATNGQIPMWDDTAKRWKVQTPFSEATLYSAKGDILIGSGAGSRARLGVGSPGQALTANPAAPLGVDWENVVRLLHNGTGISVDNSDPTNPIINATGGLPSGGTSPNVLTQVSGGTVQWMGNVVVLINHGAAVPSGTPVGAIIVEKA